MANVLGELFGDIASAIREKTGDGRTMKPLDFPEKIIGISTGTDVSGVTATAADVLEGKSIVDAEGNTIAGSMTDNGALSTNLNTARRSFNIPKGYHNGDGIIKVSSTSRTVVPSKKRQTVRDGASETQSYFEVVYVEPIPDKYQDVSRVTAAAEDVLEGKVFVDAQGNEIVGTFVYDVPNPGETILFKKQKASGFAEDAEMGAYTPGFVTPAAFVLEEGSHYRVNWDGEDFPGCEAFAFELSGSSIVAIGNASSFMLPGNGEPFLIIYNVTYNNTQIFTTDEDADHFVGIYLEEESVDVTVSDEIWAGSSTSNSLVGSGIIRYVTFMNHDGTVEYGRKSVIRGENCVDPVTSGFLDTPTRESTPQYSYTYAGWATQPNGGLDSSALKAVTDDRTVYANFVSVLRYYTVTFYDSDGTTVLATKSVAYGSVPSYEPSKQGLTFSNWIPEPVAVTGATSYQAVWVDKPNFQNSDWATIKQVCDEGKASEYFKVGDKRPITLTYADGTSETINFTIVDMGVDIKEDGTPAALTIMADNLVKKSLQPASKKPSHYCFTSYDNATTFFAELLAALPVDLQEVIASVIKYDAHGWGTNYYAKIFIPNQKNLENKITANSSFYGNTDIVPYVQYKYFANGAAKNRTKLGNSTADDYWTATLFNDTSSVLMGVWVDGGVVQGSSNSVHGTSHGIVPCFCI